jgi:cytochrome c553
VLQISLLMTVALAAGADVATSGDAPFAGTEPPSHSTALGIEAGRRWWSASPDPGNPVACATCHDDPRETRFWAASFPKFRPLPPPHGRVMTLLQATAEAVRRHYGPADVLPVATAITAYLAAHGANAPRSPGIVPGEPAFPRRLRALAESVARGRRSFAARCSGCHDPISTAGAAAGMPRARRDHVESLEGFLEGHSGGWLVWDGAPAADLVAYLSSLLTSPREACP